MYTPPLRTLPHGPSLPLITFISSKPAIAKKETIQTKSWNALLVVTGCAAVVTGATFAPRVLPGHFQSVQRLHEHPTLKRLAAVESGGAANAAETERERETSNSKFKRGYNPEGTVQGASVVELWSSYCDVIKRSNRHSDKCNHTGVGASSRMHKAQVTTLPPPSPSIESFLGQLEGTGGVRRRPLRKGGRHTPPVSSRLRSKLPLPLSANVRTFR